MITFRQLAVADLTMLRQWLQRPHVTEWWTPTPSLEEVIVKFTPKTRPGNPVQAHVAMLDGRDIGYIQSYVVMGAGDAHEQLLGRGIGTSMVRAFVAQLFEDPLVTRVQTDPDPRNARAIRCYERAGFRRVGDVTTPDGRAPVMICERGASPPLPR